MQLKIPTKTRVVTGFSHASRGCVVCRFRSFSGMWFEPRRVRILQFKFRKEYFVSIPLYLECIVHFKFNSYRSLQNAKLS